MKAKYDAKNSRPLIDRLNSELSGSFEKVIIELLKAERNESAPADNVLAATHAQQLHEAGVGQWGTNESVFINILTKSSRAHIEAIKAEYEKQYNRSLYDAIEDETSGDFEDVLVALLYSPAEYFSRQLMKATNGIGVSNACTQYNSITCMVTLQ
jgi:Annexin